MAKATKVPADYEVALTLNKREAEVLFFLLRNVGGDGARDQTNAIMEALRCAGVERVNFRTHEKLNAFYFAA